MQRRLGVASAAALVVANMIGAGAFTTSGFALADLGAPAPVLLAWVVGGAVAMCGALSYGALARIVPESGGEYTFLSRTVHPLAGFLAGWVSLLVGFTAPIAAAALALQAYLGEAFDTHLRPEWIGTAAILVAGAMHGLRLRAGVAVQNAAVALNLLLLAGFIALGAPRLAAGGAALTRGAVAVDPAAFARTLVWVSFAYSGWNAAVYIAGELRDPERDLRRALCGATALVTVLYVALNAVFLSAAPLAALAGRADIGAVAAEALGGVALRRAVAALVALALLTSISSMVMAGPRVYARMAADGVLPAVFARGDEVPRAAVALQLGLAILAVWVSSLVALLGYIGFTLGLCAAASVAALLARRRRDGAARVPIPGYPWVPLLFIAVTVGASALMVVRAPGEAALGVLTVAAGVPVYVVTRRATRRRNVRGNERDRAPTSGVPRTETRSS